MGTSFFDQEELRSLGLAAFGRNVLISRKASIYDPARLRVGDDVRIDDFCVISGAITLGSNIHISAYCALYGSHSIEIMNYSGLSPRCTVFSASDDFSGEYMISPMVPKEYTNVQGGKVRIERFCQVGAGSIVMPGVQIHEGVAVGALSFVKADLAEWGIYAGNPARFIRERKRGILEKAAVLELSKAKSELEG